MAAAFAALHGPQGVRDHNAGRPGIAVTLREIARPYLPKRALVQLSSDGGGAAQQGAASDQPGGGHGTVAGVVAGSRIGLLVTGVVLLVHDDQFQPFQGQKEGRPGPHDELAPSGPAQGQVGLRAPHVGQFRMVGRDAAAEDALQPLDELGREGDFGHQHQHVVARCQRLGNQMDVNFGLSGAGDAVQQHRGRLPELPPDLR